jgi:hypothetical protein
MNSRRLMDPPARPTTAPYHTSGADRQRCTLLQISPTDFRNGSNSTVKLHLWDGSLPLDSFRAVRMPATEVVGLGRVKRR